MIRNHFSSLKPFKPKLKQRGKKKSAGMIAREPGNEEEGMKRKRENPHSSLCGQQQVLLKIHVDWFSQKLKKNGHVLHKPTASLTVPYFILLLDVSSPFQEGFCVECWAWSHRRMQSDMLDPFTLNICCVLLFVIDFPVTLPTKGSQI